LHHGGAEGRPVADAATRQLAGEFWKLRREALLDNPLLGFGQLLLLKRRRGQLGLPVNHKCNTGIEQTGYDNEIAVLSAVRAGGKLRTLFRPPGRFYVGQIDLHFDAQKLLFTMPNGRTWQIHEIGLDGSGLRQLSRELPDVDNFDGAYLPDGGVVFCSTASFHAVPCWHGQQRACAIYRMDADGAGVRQLCFDQDLDLHPAVLPNGKIIFSRWDYTGTMHMYLRPLMVMNPDGTGQRAIYGSNSYWPNALYFPRGVPGSPNHLVAIAAGYHGVPRMGIPVLIDVNRGWRGARGVVQFVPGRGKTFDGTVIQDTWYSKTWPKFLHPFPLSEKYFLAAAQRNPKAPWGIYLLDVFDNMVAVISNAKFDFFEPVPLKRRHRPPVIPPRVDPTRQDAVVYLHDVYAGAGLAGVPRGTIKRLRVVAYHFGYPGLAGPDKIGCGGPWEAMRIIGTVPVDADGSAMFRVPANTPLAFQPLDAEGKAVQLMRSWLTAMPGEAISCVGCHERPNETPAAHYAAAAGRAPQELRPWYGPPRGFDFEREVQPVLDKYCVECHDGGRRPDGRKIADLRAERFAPEYPGRPLTKLAAGRLHPQVRRFLGGESIRYTPAYEALVPLVRRVGIEDEVHMLVPGEYHADTSQLVQMLRRGHYGVQLDAEAWDRLITWIDLNAPCHGTWADVAPVPDRADRRRWELQQQYGGPVVDFETVPQVPGKPCAPVKPDPPTPPAAVRKLDGWPFDAAEARRRQAAAVSLGPGNSGPVEKTIRLGGGVTMKLLRIPGGKFLMGDPGGESDERAVSPVNIERPFWIGACEVTNEQFGRFDANHQSGRFAKRYASMDGPGLSLDGGRQPVVRVSWRRAMAFCRWLSQHSGINFSLPTEAQWEYACRAGTDTPLWFGTADDDFSASANLADKSLGNPPQRTGGLGSNINIKGILLEAQIGGDIPCETRFDDRVVATARVGRYRPNAWGLFDMHGNAAEWTRSDYCPAGDCKARPKDNSGTVPIFPQGKWDCPTGKLKVVRGGSWCDRPKHARSALRLGYPEWQRVHNVGFRVVAE